MTREPATAAGPAAEGWCEACGFAHVPEWVDCILASQPVAWCRCLDADQNPHRVDAHEARTVWVDAHGDEIIGYIDVLDPEAGS